MGASLQSMALLYKIMRVQEPFSIYRFIFNLLSASAALCNLGGVQDFKILENSLAMKLYLL